jgi:xanthine/CO dehydrogenase XdhC/CoxF family maturation factor
VDEVRIARLHAPRLSIGSKRPMEVAIAILAQLTAAARGTSA